MQKQHQPLNEGLRPLDLKEMVMPTFEVDTYRSKMGEDKDVCVLSFTVKDRLPAKDLMEFIEKGYHFVLDADVSSGENENGEYSVFVELSRNPKLAEQIREITYGVKRLTGIDDWTFKYHKNSNIYEVSEETLKNIVPKSPEDYEISMIRVKTESLKKFFNRTLMDDLTLEGNTITIHKPFGQKIYLEWLSEDDPQSIVEAAPSIDESSTAEIFWLTKVLGDYDISKFGDKLLFTNGDKAMLLKRTEK
jgi:hypothetical protein